MTITAGISSHPDDLYFFDKGKGAIGGNTVGGNIVQGNINVDGKLYCSYDENEPKEIYIDEEIEGTRISLSTIEGERIWYLTKSEIKNVQAVYAKLNGEKMKKFIRKS